MMTLEEKLEREIARLYGLARFNYRTAYALSAIAALASVIAGVTVAGQWLPVSVRAALSVLPGAILIIQDRLKFDERSAWHYRKLHAVEGLLHQLFYEGKSEAEVSEEWRKITETLRPLWPGFGKPTEGST